MNYTQPTIDLSKIDLTPEEREIASGIINTRTGQLRASKPKVTRIQTSELETGRKVYTAEHTSGCTAYVWRMVAFMVSPVRAHQCMPVTAYFDLPTDYSLPADERRETRKQLEKAMDAIADKIVDSIPRSQHHGIITWGRALGYLDRPTGEL